MTHWPFRSAALALRATPALRRKLLATGRPAEQDERLLAPLPAPDGTGHFIERGLHWPLGIAVCLALMVLWNGFFLTMALRNPPGVDPAWTHAVDR